MIAGIARGLFVIIALGAALALVPATQAEAKPRRIVSINLCADQLLLLLADRETIVSLSYFATDPDISYMAEAARGIPVNHGRAEEILLLKPDLVLTGPYTTRTSAALLRRLGVRVHVVPVPDSLDGVRRITRDVAAALGEAERGARLIAEMDRRLKAIPRSPGPRPVAATWRANSISVGRDTLVHDVLVAAGLDNLAAGLGMSGYVHLPLESLLLAEPDVVVFGSIDAKHPSLGQEVLRHPALKPAARRWRTVTVPARLWVCGTPFVAEAIERLAASRERASQARVGEVERR